MAFAFDLKSECVLDFFDVGNEGRCEILKKNANGFLILLTTKELMDEYNLIFHSKFKTDTYKDLTVCEDFRPSEDDLVVYDVNGEQRRGRVVCVPRNGMYRIADFDTCSVHVEKRLKPVPLQFRTIPHFGVQAIVSPSERFGLENVVEAGMQFIILITAREGNHVTAELTSPHVDGDITFEASLLPWWPDYRDTGLRCVKLLNKSEVQIVSYCGQHCIHLIVTDEDNWNFRLGVLNDVAAYCVKAPVMEQYPDQSEIVASLFSQDGVYRRALVLRRVEDRVQVMYLDFGNIEYVTLDRLKPLAEIFQQIPKTAIHVRLNDVTDCPLTPRAILYIDWVIMSEVKMTVTFTNSYADGVNLVTVESGDNFNKIVNDCLTPKWKLAAAVGKPLHGAEIFFAKDIKFFSLPEGNTFKLLVLHQETHSKFYGCDYCNGSTSYILNKLPSEMLAYCNTLKDVGYKPRIDELCLAKCDDKWCRAVCLHAGPKSCSVYFIDWGHKMSMTLTSLRRMPKAFVGFPAVANTCFIYGLRTKRSVGLRKRLMELVPTHSHHNATVVSKKNYTYHVSLPDVMDTLSQEGYM